MRKVDRYAPLLKGLVPEAEARLGPMRSRVSRSMKEGNNSVTFKNLIEIVSTSSTLHEHTMRKVDKYAPLLKGLVPEAEARLGPMRSRVSPSMKEGNNSVTFKNLIEIVSTRSYQIGSLALGAKLQASWSKVPGNFHLSFDWK